MSGHDRQSVLRLLAAGDGVSLGATGQALAGSDTGSGALRLFGEAGVPKAHETVVEGTRAYVATGDRGMTVVDWRNPANPELVAEVDLADSDPELKAGDIAVEVLDVKVDGDVAAVVNETESPGGIALYDVSDPANPEFRSFYAPEPPSDIHNCHLADGYAYLSLGEPENTDIDGDGQRDLVRIFGDAGVEIVDVSDPAGPEHAATWLLKEELPNYAKAGVNPCHDLYTQDGLCDAAFWDAGTVALDVSDPADPTFVSQFGAAPNGDTVIRPWNVNDETFDAYLDEVFPLGRYLGPPGNAHYVQPSPTATMSPSAPRRSSAARAGSTSGTSPTSRPRRRWAASTRRTSMPSGRPTNFDITTNRLHASWYAGGVRVYDVTDPSDPAERAHYDPDGYAFWTAERGRGYTVGGVYGDRSATEGGIVVLSDDRGEKRPPAFDGAASPEEPGTMPEDGA